MHNHANIRIIYEKTMGQVLLGPLLGKENIQAKEVYCSGDIVLFFVFRPSYGTKLAVSIFCCSSA